MLAKYWKKIGLFILIVACIFNILNKLVKKVSFNTELEASATYVNQIYQEENTSNDYNDNVSEKNDEDIERKRMLEEYFADQDGKDSKAKRTKTRGKHF